MYDLPKFVPCHAETKSFALAFINNEDWSMKEHLLLHLNKGFENTSNEVSAVCLCLYP